MRNLTKISRNNFAIFKNKYLIIGGGDGGSGVASILHSKYKVPNQDMTIIDRTDLYTYQSGQTMVGGGLKHKEQLQTTLSKRHLNRDFKIDKITQINPEKNQVISEENEYYYDVLIISSGVQAQKFSIKGLEEALNNPNSPVGSNYFMEYAEKMNSIRQSFQGGKFIFTQPSTPIKCGGAPQKIMYLCNQTFQDKYLDFEFEFHTGTPSIFAVPYYAKTLNKICDQNNIKRFYKSELIEVNSQDRIATFKNLETQQLSQVKYDGMHVTPHMHTADFIKQSSLSNPNGYVAVDQYTLQSSKFQNVFALGDCADLPTSKTLSAVNEQIHIVSQNIDSYVKGQPIEAQYNGYTACPIFVGNNKILLCEFGYNNEQMPTFFKNQDEPSYLAFLLKSHVFNYMAMNGLCQYVKPMRDLFGARLRNNKQQIIYYMNNIFFQQKIFQYQKLILFYFYFIFYKFSKFKKLLFIPQYKILLKFFKFHCNKHLLFFIKSYFCQIFKIKLTLYLKP